jgi:hypothetical protein
MKRALLFLSLFFFLAGCQKTGTVTPSAEPVATANPSAEEQDSDSRLVRYNLIIRDQNFGVEEMFVQKDQPLIISLRNQIDDPVNITIDGLPIHTKNVEKGEIVEVEIPTNIPGEYEVYSSVGNQRSEGFSTLLTIEE